MKGKIARTVLVIALIGSMVMAFGLSSATAGEKKYNLSFTSAYFDKHPTVKNGWIPWTKQLADMSKGRLTIEYFNPNTLCPSKDNFDATVDGILDIGANYNGLNPGKFPVSEVMELPLIVPSAEAGAMVVWDLYNKYPAWRNEYKGVEILWQWTSATYQLHTTKKLVKNLDDLKGMKILCWSPKLISIMKMLGANPIQVQPPDSYLALQRGMAEGVLCPLAPVRSFKITDAAKYHTIVDLLVGPFWAGANLDVWGSLPDDLKKMLKDTTGQKLAVISGKTLDAGAIEDSDWMKSQGHEFYRLPDEERARWAQKVMPLREKWVKEMEAKGVKNAAQILEDAVSLGEKYSKVTGRGYK